MLKFSRLERRELGAIAPAAVVEDCLGLARAAISNAIALERRIGATRLSVLADATELQQVVLNLCTNAAHAIGQQTGTITVSLALAQPQQLNDAERGSSRRYLVLAVHDTGSGIAPEHLGRLFDPFFTTKGVGQGTGLGLSVVHGIVSSFGGRIQVDSTLGKGTTFAIVLPVLEALPQTATWDRPYPSCSTSARSC
ncbi:MAG: signal transduction histidine kinase [Myxococcota bacterium]|jgi:signal transduction histidine kinase